MIVCRACGGHGQDGDTVCPQCGSYLGWAAVKAPESEPTPEPTRPVPLLVHLGQRDGDAPPPSPVAPALILCTACGEQSPADEQFCPSCGAYLEWHGETLGSGDPEPVPVSAFPAPAAAVMPREPRLPPRPRPVPTAVRPGVARPAPRRKVTAAPEPEVPTGGPTCPDCRQANAPGRRFCRRCGASLAEIEVVVIAPLPWWRRWWNAVVAHLARPAVRAKAGERPVRRRRSTSGLQRNLFRLAPVLVLVAVLVPGIRERVGDAVRGPYRSVKDALTQTYSPVRPIRVTASSSAPGHGPGLAADRLSNTYWAEGAPGSGEGEKITFVFHDPVNLARVIITSGASGADDAFLKEPRPRILHVVSDSGGTDEIVLEDVPAPQTFKLHVDHATKIEFDITLVHPSATGTDCAISEFEFFTKH